MSSPPLPVDVTPSFARRPDRRWLVVSLHDVAASTAAATSAWMDHLLTRSLDVSLLAVPGPWRSPFGLRSDPGLVAWLRSLVDAGHEVVQHGWDHSAVATFPRPSRRARAVGSIVARGCGEFWTLDVSEAIRRMVQGRDALVDLGLPPAGFIAPAWLMSKGAWSAAKIVGYEYTTSHRKIVHLPSGRSVGCLALAQRVQRGFVRIGAQVNTAAVRQAIRSGAPIRLAIHPEDITDRHALSSVLTACSMAADAGYRSLTYQRLVGELFDGAGSAPDEPRGAALSTATTATIGTIGSAERRF